MAQEPLPRREASRLLHLHPDGGIEHRRFTDLPSLLDPRDLLVLNDTRVVPARLFGRRGTGGAVELLLLERIEEGRFRALARPARKVAAGDVLDFGGGRLRGLVEAVEAGGGRIVRFEHEGAWDDVLDELGTTPLPPYIERPRREGPADEVERQARERYQTVYAKERGSVAAPTAGLHFTDAIFEALRVRGIGVTSLTLHVGYATFEPIRTEELDRHTMGTERFLVPRETAEAIRRTRERGGRVVAVGTTSVRALESAALLGFPDGWQTSSLFIAPGFSFRVVDGLLTNFHLPRSSLLVLVSALGGSDLVRRAYTEAVRRRYRFYSFGDAMLVHPARHGARAVLSERESPVHNPPT